MQSQQVLKQSLYQELVVKQGTDFKVQEYISKVLKRLLEKAGIESDMTHDKQSRKKVMDVVHKWAHEDQGNLYLGTNNVCVTDTLHPNTSTSQSHTPINPVCRLRSYDDGQHFLSRIL